MSILLVSGGLDSIAAWRLLGCPKAVYFPLGTAAQPRELSALTWAQRQEWATRSPWIGHKVRMDAHEGLNGYVPYRNLILVALAAQHDPHVIVPMIAEWAPDKNRRFFNRLARLLTDAGSGDFQGIDTDVTVETPFAHLTKAQLLTRYMLTFGPAEMGELLEHTWSCYRDGSRLPRMLADGLHCGACSGCVQRYVAEITVLDGGHVTRYATTPDVRSFYSNPSLRDALRWLRGNGHRSLFDLTRRALEARRAFATPATQPEVD